MGVDVWGRGARVTRWLGGVPKKALLHQIAEGMLP